MCRLTFVLTCNKCKQTKKPDQFRARSNGTLDTSNCIDCDRANKKSKYNYGMSVLRRYKTIKGCVKCGYNSHHAALEFNHREPTKKKFTLGQRAASITAKRGCKSFLELRKELNKCDVLCGNCHGILTFEKGHQSNRG